MSQKKQTPEERFLIELDRQSRQHGDRASFDPFKIGALLGYKEISVRQTVKSLSQANLIQKHGDDSISMTPRGRQVVQDT
jgi:Mn-dependent DtxR family transcriptional regulator